MIFKDCIIEDITLSLQRKNSGEKEITGKLISLKPGLGTAKEPIVTILDSGARVECKQDKYHLRSISIITGGISASSFYSLEYQSQQTSWVSLAKIFMDLTTQGNVSKAGLIDWDKNGNRTGKSDIILDSSSLKSSARKTTAIKTVAKKEDKPMYIRRRTKKPSEEFLSTLKEKLKAIAAKTYEPIVPIISIVGSDIINEEQAEEEEAVDASVWADMGMA